MADEIAGAQVRMARAFLRWSIAELAKRAGVGRSTVDAIEAVDGSPAITGGGLETTADYRAKARGESLDAIRQALTKAGITFLPPDAAGIGVRGKPAKRAR